MFMKRQRFACSQALQAHLFNFCSIRTKMPSVKIINSNSFRYIFFAFLCDCESRQNQFKFNTTRFITLFRWHNRIDLIFKSSDLKTYTLSKRSAQRIYCNGTIHLPTALIGKLSLTLKYVHTSNRNVYTSPFFKHNFYNGSTYISMGLFNT